VSITKKGKNKAAVSGAEVGEMVAQLMISRKIMHGHGAATVRVGFSKKRNVLHSTNTKLCAFQ
jgi:hypothetical protein